MESINRDRTDLRALFDSPPPRSIGFASGESRVMSISSASLMYIERYHFDHFLSSWNILEFSQVKCQLFRTIFTWNFFSDHQSRERRLEGLCFIKYIGNLFENYAIRGI